MCKFTLNGRHIEVDVYEGEVWDLSHGGYILLDDGYAAEILKVVDLWFKSEFKAVELDEFIVKMLGKP